MSGEAGYPFGKELRAMFPEQTRSIPVFLLWCIIYLLDAAFVFWLYFKMGFSLGAGTQDSQMVMIALLLIAALGLLKVETFICNKIVSLFR